MLWNQMTCQMTQYPRKCININIRNDIQLKQQALLKWQLPNWRRLVKGHWLNKDLDRCRPPDRKDVWLGDWIRIRLSNGERSEMRRVALQFLWSRMPPSVGETLGFAHHPLVCLCTVQHSFFLSEQKCNHSETGTVVDTEGTASCYTFSTWDAKTGATSSLISKAIY
jgi:hypothetical protein